MHCRHLRQDKDDTGNTDAQSLKPHTKVLRTVPEERQVSKESEHSNSVDQHSQISKYKYTELDEHNRLDEDECRRGSNYEQKGTHEENENTSATKMTLFEKYARIAGMVAKRSIFKR